MDSHDAFFPALVAELGAGKQQEDDSFASLLVQVLGVKESADLKEGFGFFVQHVLSGGLEKAHAEEKEGGEQEGRMQEAGPEDPWETGIRLMAEAMTRAVEGRSGMGDEVVAGMGSWRDGGSRRGMGGETGSGRRMGGGRGSRRGMGGEEGCGTGMGQDGGSGRGMEEELYGMMGSAWGGVRREELPVGVEEWPRGDEAAAKLPKDLSARCFRLGVVKESGSREEGGGKASKEAGNTVGRPGRTRRAMRGRGGGGVSRNASRGSGSGVGRGTAHGDDAPSFAEALAASVAPQNQKIPIVRCTADAEFLVEFAGHLVSPPACARCSKCFNTFTCFLPALTLIATFAYQPASALFNRFVSVFPPHSPEFNELLADLQMEPLPTDVPALLNSFRWPKAVLQIEELDEAGWDEVSGDGSGEGCREGRRATGKEGEKRGRRGGRRGGGSGRDERDGGGEVVGECGEVWEEVRSWCLAAMVAWKASLRLVGAGLGEACEGSKHLGEGETKRGAKMWQKAVETRYCEELDDGGGSGSGSRRGGSSRGSGRSSGGRSSGGRSSSGSRSGGGSWWGWGGGNKGKGKKEEEAAYVKAWPGGVNLVACLREMLLGEPCYCPSFPVASSPAAGST
ncbi:unnamed protein product [Closterium sp. Naga37s-1]|nr:unnamed protein product [Closterium sp. Naga37s-1]